MIAACLGEASGALHLGEGKRKRERGEGPSTLGFQLGSVGYLFYLSLIFMFFVRLLWEWAGVQMFIGLALEFPLILLKGCGCS